ncbi:DUF3889 domain-containing protein [Paenibacillus sp. S3N08]|uniref:DUF3889 domain-containing protein n=2 Tax=Paenibacillus agricola TaxID=2716264 RepID=A0ABX0J932_9BACL|nr:DUF3889 domain-containing protein [Paenibacillus agricola]
MKLLMLLLILLAFVTSSVLAAPAPSPSYAKWSKQALEAAQKEYHASIVDYLHVGRTDIAEDIAEEKFKLWLRNEGGEFGVFVTIRFNPSTEQVLQTSFKKASS